MAAKKKSAKKKKAAQAEAKPRKYGALSAQLTFRVAPTVRKWLDRKRSRMGMRGLADVARYVLDEARKAEGGA